MNFSPFTVAFGNNSHGAERATHNPAPDFSPTIYQLITEHFRGSTPYGLIRPFCICFANSSHNYSMSTPFYK